MKKKIWITGIVIVLCVLAAVLWGLYGRVDVTQIEKISAPGGQLNEAETEEFLWIFKTAAYRIPIEGGTTIDPVCTIYLENGEKIWIYERGGQVFKVCYVRDGTKTRSYFIKSKLLDVFLEERWDRIKTKGA